MLSYPRSFKINLAEMSVRKEKINGYEEESGQEESRKKESCEKGWLPDQRRLEVTVRKSTRNRNSHRCGNERAPALS